jgi:hypothetical protein
MWKSEQQTEIRRRLDAITKTARGKSGTPAHDLHKDFRLITGMMDSEERTALEQKLLSSLLKFEGPF